MNILTEALDTLMESQGFSRIYNEIRQNIVNSDAGVESGGFATNSWLAGLLASRGSSIGKLARLVAALDADMLDPESKEYRDAKRTKIAFETLYRHGMVKRDPKGRFTFPSSAPADAGRRSKLSNFRNFLSSGFNTDKEQADLGVVHRTAARAAVEEMVDSFPAEQKQSAIAYSKLTLSAYNLLVSLYNKKGPKDVAALRDTMNRLSFKESTDLMLLKDLGLVSDKGLLNRSAVDGFVKFIRSATAPQLLALNKEVATTTKLSQHTRQRSLNAAGRGEDYEAERGDDTVQSKDEMNPEEERAMYSRIRDAAGGTKNTTRNARAGGYQRTFSDTFKNAFD